MSGSTAPSPELRVLSGLHAGARVPLTQDAYSIGSSEDCDLVLADAGMEATHATLMQVRDGWELRPGGPIGDGRAVQVGPLILTVQEADRPWPTLDQLVLSAVPRSSEPAADPDADLRAFPPAQAQDAPRAQRKSRSRSALLALAVASLSASALALVAWPDAARRLGKEEPQAAAADPVAQQRHAIDTVLGAHGLAASTQLKYTADGWIVRPPLLDDAASRALSSALASLKPRPKLQLAAEQDVRDQVTERLLVLASERGERVTLGGTGLKFRLEGHVATPEQRDKFARALAADFPQVREWDNAIAAGDDAARRLLTMIRNHGWQAEGQISNGVLEMEVSLPREETRAWEMAMLAAMKKEPIPFSATLVHPQGLAPASVPVERAAVQLPFDVRGIVGGSVPYVLLAEGQKLAPGSTWQGWRFAAVTATEVVFESGGRRATITR